MCQYACDFVMEWLNVHKNCIGMQFIWCKVLLFIDDIADTY